ncbi:unnamed protein product, partial [marine sediment metagenome]
HEVFDPQRGNAATMLAALVAIASQRDAAPSAIDLLRRLRGSTLKPCPQNAADLLDEIAGFLKVILNLPMKTGERGSTDIRHEELDPAHTPILEQSRPPRNRDETEQLSVPQQTDILKRLQPAQRKAYLSYEFTESKAGKRLEDRDAYNLLQDERFSEDADDLRELTDYELPAFDTWTRHLRSARNALDEQKYTRRHGRPLGGSVVKADEIEYQHGDDE